MPPRIIAHEICPSATSRAPSDVAIIAWYSFMKCILKNTLNVESKMAPFMALDASSAGARKTT